MRTFLLSMLGAFVALILFSLALVGLLMSAIGSAASEPPRPEAQVISIDMRIAYPDQAPSGGLAALGGSFGFTDILLNLRAAETDPSVKGIFIRASEFGIGSSRAEEMRDALIRLKANGKFVVVHSQGALIGGPSTYRAIAPADEIWLQPGADISIPGVSFESLFLGGALDKLKVVPQFVQLYEYKDYVYTFTESGYTDTQDESLGLIANTVWDISIADIAADRGLDPVGLRALLESSPIRDEDALAGGLVTRLGWPEEARIAAQERAGSADTPIVDIAAYRAPALDQDETPFIALIGGEGGIVTGTGQGGPFDAEASFASDRMAQAIYDAANNDDVRAIVFRIDSGGGSAIASDQIWRAVETAQEKGKPVVVSMGSVAASGGYYVAAGADFIYALDTTITGSIGVLGGKFAVADAAASIGLNFDTLSVGGDFADAFGAEPFTPTQYAAFEASLVRTYDRFIGIVAEGRGMSVNEVGSIARGRVWAGRDAREIGLVDARGGLIEAIEKAKELGGIDPSLTPVLVRYPEPTSGIEVLTSLIGVEAATPSVAMQLRAILTEPEARLALEQLRRAQALQRGQVEAAAPLFIER